jgi:hypothetical protein
VDTPPSNVGPFGFKFHQVAMYTNYMERAVMEYTALGYKDWIYDKAVLTGYLWSGNKWLEAETQAHMAFNYQIMPMELEFLTYIGGAHRHLERSQLSAVPFISHMSVHVEDLLVTKAIMERVHGMTPYHLFVTSNHSNPMVRNKKRFVECIYDTRGKLGYDIKLIQRIPWDFNKTAWDYLANSIRADYSTRL